MSQFRHNLNEDWAWLSSAPACWHFFITRTNIHLFVTNSKSKCQKTKSYSWMNLEDFCQKLPIVRFLTNYKGEILNISQTEDLCFVYSGKAVFIRDSIKDFGPSRSTHPPFPLLGTPFLGKYPWSLYPPTHNLFGNFCDTIRTFQHQSQKMQKLIFTYSCKIIVCKRKLTLSIQMSSKT